MLKLFVPAIVLVSLIAVPAYSQAITDETKCRSEVDIVKDLDDENDVGPKFEGIVKDLIGVLEHLCAEKDYAQAEDVAGAIRGMLATEEPAEGPKQKDL